MQQRCDNNRPCANCTRSNQQCIEPPTGPEQQIYGYSAHDSLGRLADIASLEERISRLEDNQSRQEDDRGRRQPSSLAAQSWSNGAAPIGQLPLLHQPTQSVSTAGHPSNLNLGDSFSDDAKEKLFALYTEKVHSRYPFLRVDHLRQTSGPYSAFFCNLIYSIGLLLGGTTFSPSPGHSQQEYYDAAVKNHLPAVLGQSDRLLHIQAHLLLSMHALFSPSTEGIISAASTTMRYCVMAQLHLADTEPPSTDAGSKVLIQMRRRIFWSAYALDRTVSVVFDLPFCIPDSQISVKLFSNINDSDLETCCQDAFPNDPPSFPSLTNVSAAMHVVYCRQIQSEILNTTLHRDFWKSMDTHHRWRLRVIEKLDKWRSLCHRYADKRDINFSNSEWLHMIYNYSLAMLYQPTKITASESAGDWTVKACTQALLIFRKFQRQRPLTDLWLGLIEQFKCGVALLYCFFATPPEKRSSTYETLDVSEAVRACSVTLSLLAERWPSSKCVRDSFDLLAREIPLFEPSRTKTDSSRHMRSESSDALKQLLPQIEPLVVHRGTLRMVREMMSDEFPRPSVERTSNRDEFNTTDENSAAADAAGDIGSLCSGMTENFFQPFTPQYMLLDNMTDTADQVDPSSLWFPGDFDLNASFLT